MYISKLNSPVVLYVFSEKAAPLDQDTNTGTQPLPIPNTSYSKVVCSSPAASLGNSPCHSPMLREEDELSETGESEGEDEDEGRGPHGMESDVEVTEVDMNDMDMNKVCCFLSSLHVVYVLICEFQTV